MNENLVKLLIHHRKQYEELFENFPYKSDPIAVSEHEKTYYLNDFEDQVIPLLVKQLNLNKQDIVTNYLTYIDTKYHHFVLTKVLEMQQEIEARCKEINKTIDKEFSSGLLENNNKTDDEKENFIQYFMFQYGDKLLKISHEKPDILLSTTGKMRNPKLQFDLLKSPGEIKNNLTSYIGSLTTPHFEEVIKKYFIYPLDTSAENYYKKWIGKDKIHIKLAKDIFSDAEQYEQAKSLLKNLPEVIRPEDPVHNGINFQATIVEKPKKAEKEVKKKIKPKAKKGFKSIFKMF